MSKYRFAGTIKGIEIQAKNLVFSFIPDSDYSSVFKKEKRETKFAIIQPDVKGVGYVFTYKEFVKVEVSSTEVCPRLAPSIHYILELADTPSSYICRVKFKDMKVAKKNMFGITAITAL